MSSSLDTSYWTDDRTATADGLEIAYRDYGGVGPAVVLLPGIGGNLEALHELAQRLGPRWRVVSIDPRGIGQSGESEIITTADLVRDVETVVSVLELRPCAVVGASLGGIIAGAYATSHPETPIISIDGFAGGVASIGTEEDHRMLRDFLERARHGLRGMTAAPEQGDETWKLDQIERIAQTLDAMGYHAPHRAAMVARQFVRRPGGQWARHPSSKLVDLAEREAFGSDPPGNIVSMFRTCTGPVLIVRCTRSDWPPVLDLELDDLVEQHPNIAVHRLPLTHTGPVTDGVALTTAEVTAFLETHLPAERLR